MYILNYSCTTAAGPGTENLMQALYAGRDCSQPAGDAPGRICSIGPKQKSYQATLQDHFQELWAGIQSALPANVSNCRVGLIFASTKGFIEDFVWTANADSIRQQPDPFNALIEDFCKIQAQIPWSISCNICNACSSTHVALEYIQDLFAADRLDYAVMIAADLVGPFVFKGFSSLKLVSPTTHRPFSGNREGLQLGEAVGMVLLSKEDIAGGSLRIARVASETEGSSITRPSMNGDGLLRAMDRLRVFSGVRPDLVIAHGTGTKFNDLTEELALRRFLGSLEKTSIPITSTKWSIGHTLGASGCVDLIAACEILKRQKVFRIANSAEKDPSFELNYLTAGAVADEDLRINQILISSLGFGGVHAALLLTGGPS